MCVCVCVCVCVCGSGHSTPNMAPWHITYFKLTELRKQQKQKDLSQLPLPFSPEAGHKTLL